MTQTPTVLITGATGQQGGTLAHLLRKRDVPVRALTRRPDSPAARALKEAGAEIAPGDLADPASVRAALAGCGAVFAVLTPYEAGPDAEIAQGEALVAAAREAGVGHFVYSSVASADRRTGIPHFESKRRVEETLAQSGLPYTIIGPVFFSENLLTMFLSGIKSGALSMALPAGRPLQVISVAEIAAFSALVLTQPGSFVGSRIDIAGDEVTPAQMAAALGEAAGRTVTYQALPIAALRQFSEDLALMFEWFDRVGYNVDIAALRQNYPQVGWRRFDQWVMDPQVRSAL